METRGEWVTLSSYQGCGGRDLEDDVCGEKGRRGSLT